MKLERLKLVLKSVKKRKYAEETAQWTRERENEFEQHKKRLEYAPNFRDIIFRKNLKMIGEVRGFWGDFPHRDLLEKGTQ